MEGILIWKNGTVSSEFSAFMLSAFGEGRGQNCSGQQNSKRIAITFWA